MIGGNHMSRDNPHYYKPLPLPLADALHFVKKYGPYAQKKRSSVRLQRSPQECISRQRPQRMNEIQIIFSFIIYDPSKSRITGHLYVFLGESEKSHIFSQENL